MRNLERLSELGRDVGNALDKLKVEHYPYVIYEYCISIKFIAQGIPFTLYIHPCPKRMIHAVILCPGGILISKDLKQWGNVNPSNEIPEWAAYLAVLSF